MPVSKKLGITDVVLRDAHQSILATRMRIDDMLPIASKLDQVGYWSLESWAARHSTPAFASSVKIPGIASVNSKKPCRRPNSKCCCAVRTCLATVIMLMTW